MQSIATRPSLRPIFGVAAAALLLGAGAGSLVTAVAARHRLDAAAQALASSQARIGMLSLALQRQGETVASLALQRPAAADAQPATPAAGSLAPPQLQPSRARPSRAPVPGGAGTGAPASGTPASPAVARAAAVAGAAQLRQAQARPASPPSSAASQAAPTAPTAPQMPPLPAQPVAPHEVARARSSNSIEAVPAAKIGVARITGDAVIMQSGTRVPIGARFTSGERLLSVDPSTGQIVTNERTILLL